MKPGPGWVLLFLGSAACSHTAAKLRISPADAASTLPPDAPATGMSATDTGTARPDAPTVDVPTNEGGPPTIDTAANPDTGIVVTPVIIDAGTAEGGQPDAASSNATGSAPVRNETVTIVDQGRTRTV